MEQTKVCFPSKKMKNILPVPQKKRVIGRFE